MSAMLGERTARACAMFGLMPGAVTEPPAIDGAALRAIHELDAREQGRVVFITGPSGAGKSTLLRAIASGWPGPVVTPPLKLREVPVAEQCKRLSLERWMGVLARSGLAEARIFPRTPRQLSVGERARLCVALAIARVPEAESAPGRAPSLVVLDEFASTLDRISGRGLAVTVSRWAKRTAGLVVICATSHRDIRRSLRADLEICLDLGGSASVLGAMS
ncbi:MAG: ABC transporter ATP-binding protein [Planctomycetota bacterium]